MRRVVVLMMTFGLVVVLAGCGGGSSTGAAKSAITTTWTTFFNGSTPIDKQIPLLQNGSAHRSQILVLHKLLPPGLTSKVDGITLSGSSAQVRYELITGGKSLLGGVSTGTAVKVGGKWLVSQSTFCSLVSLAGANCSG